MGPIQTLHELLSWLRRRWKIMVLCLVIGALGGLLAALRVERVYTANAVIQIINPVIVTGEEGDASTPDVTRRVQMIEQRLMSREALLDLAQRFNLFDSRPFTPAEQVALMRQSFSITSIAAAQQGFTRDGSLSALIVSASDANPQLAAAIANDLANALLRESTDSRQTNALQTVEFFRAEEDRLQAAISGLEDRIAEFSGANEAYLPAATAVLREEGGRLATSLLEVQQTLATLQSELSGQDGATQRVVTRRRTQEINDGIGQANLQAAVLTQRITDIQNTLARAPAFEQQLIALNRQMEQLQAQLTASAERRREAELGARIEVDQQAERFELLEPALVPDYPVSTSRMKVGAMGIIGGLGLGVLLAYALEWMQPALRTAQRMERELQLRPVISIPYSMPMAERRRRWMIWGFGAAVLLVAGLVLAMVLGLV